MAWCAFERFSSEDGKGSFIRRWTQMDADWEGESEGLKKRWRIIADGVRVSAGMNPCCNDSQNPGFCSTWQGIGSVGLFQGAIGIICGWVALRAETAMKVEWIAGRLQMGSPGYFNHLLYRSRKQDPKSGTI